MERFEVDIIRFTCTHIKGSGTKLRDQGSLSPTQASVGLLTSIHMIQAHGLAVGFFFFPVGRRFNNKHLFKHKLAHKCTKHLGPKVSHQF